mgnify:FL=1
MKKIDVKKVYYLFWIFVFGSIFGWFFEGIYTYIRKGVIINHSAVAIGPFNMAYGLAACVLSASLVKYKDDSNFKLFFIGFIGGSILEYVMSIGMELVLGFTAWDYSAKPFNINGRVCLLYSLAWGLLAIFWIKVVYPHVIKFIDKLEYKIGKKIALCLAIFLIFDLIFTYSAVERAKANERGIPPQNTYEEILDKTFNKEYLKNMFNNNWGK